MNDREQQTAWAMSCLGWALLAIHRGDFRSARMLHKMGETNAMRALANEPILVRKGPWT